MNSIPLIVQAAKASSVHLATLLYAQHNISVLPVKLDKSPALKYWKQLQSRVAQASTINQWHTSGLLNGVGLILGPVSGNLVVMDCDGLEAVDAFSRRFPHLTDTYTVTSGSGKGAHFYFYAKCCPKTTRAVGLDIGNVELRAEGSYVVAPPSGHPSGQRYTVTTPSRILHVFDLHEVTQWIRSLGPKPQPVARPAVRSEVQYSSAYGRAALAGEAATVRTARPGSRNMQLYRSALKLGSLIADGRIDQGSVERDLFAAAAALAADEGETSVLKTIASGIETGKASSRERYNQYA